MVLNERQLKHLQKAQHIGEWSLERKLSSEIWTQVKQQSEEFQVYLDKFLVKQKKEVKLLTGKRNDKTTN